MPPWAFSRIRHGLGVGDSLELTCARPRREPRRRSLDTLREESQVVHADLENVDEEITKIVFSQVRIVGKVRECHLGLHHPELCEMTAGVGVLSAERGSEGVNVPQCARIGFRFELAADRQTGALAEKVIVVLDCLPLAAISARSIVVTWNISPAPSQSLAVITGV